MAKLDSLLDWLDDSALVAEDVALTLEAEVVPPDSELGVGWHAVTRKGDPKSTESVRVFINRFMA